MEPLDLILNHFADFIKRELGIVYSPQNYFQLEFRLNEISKKVGASSIKELFDRFQRTNCPKLKGLLLDAATNNETSFFRDPRVFEAIRKLVMQNFVENRAFCGDLKIWSAASSAGQEAVSTSILLEECFKVTGRRLPFSILGTDVCSAVLARAKEAKYSPIEIQRGLESDLKNRYFYKDENERWSPKIEIMKNIEYHGLNLKSDFSFANPFHLILCRNVLIYQNLQGKADIISRVVKALCPGGFLVLGCGESLLGVSEEFHQENIDGAVIYRKKEAQPKVA